VIDVFQVEAASNRATTWVEPLGTLIGRIYPPAEVDRAVWTGQPFILAGQRASLNAWLDSLDESSLAVLEDHAFFWVLTAGKYGHDRLPNDRLVVLDWDSQEQHIIRESVSALERFSRLAGLSRGLQHLREEIVRIGSGHQGPWSPTLILGESGSGKEGTAHSLVAASERVGSPGLHSMSGAWLRLEEGLALSEVFGIEKRAVPLAAERAGLVETYSEGAIFVDDFDTAPVLLQEQLLRITSTPRGQKARYRRVGGQKERETNVWLLFATNANIEEMLATQKMRMDFLFRFGDRVLVVPPLQERPADIPAIARRMWTGLCEHFGIADRNSIPWRSLRDLQAKRLAWEGNVRELEALLSLVASMASMPQHRADSTGSLIEQVLARGPGYKQWFGILSSRVFTVAPQPKPPDRVAQIFHMDAGGEVDGFSPCEMKVRQLLGDVGWSTLQEIVNRHFNRDRPSRRRAFCRYLVFVHRFKSITIEEAQPLGPVKGAQARNHLRWLSEGSALLEGPPAGQTANAKITYQPGRLFREAAGALKEAP
jgi:DNA-binding NtrC family response regulator